MPVRTFLAILVIVAPFAAGFFINRTYKKIIIMTGVYAMVLVAFAVWLSRVAMNYLPSDINTVDPQILQNIIQAHIVPDHATIFYTYQILGIGMWLYCLVDDFVEIVRRRKKDPDVSSES